jgi:hypothetical protein
MIFLNLMYPLYTDITYTYPAAPPASSRAAPDRS